MCQSCHSCLGAQFSGISSLAPLRVLFLSNVPGIYPLSPPLHPKINNLCFEARQLFAQKSTQGLGCCSGLEGKCSKYCFHILFFPVGPWYKSSYKSFNFILKHTEMLSKKVLFPPTIAFLMCFLSLSSGSLRTSCSQAWETSVSNIFELHSKHSTHFRVKHS